MYFTVIRNKINSCAIRKYRQNIYVVIGNEECLSVQDLKPKALKK